MRKELLYSPYRYLFLSILSFSCTVELHLSGRWLSVSPIIRIGSALRVNFLKRLQNYLALKIPVIGSSTIVLWLLEFQISRDRKV